MDAIPTLSVHITRVDITPFQYEFLQRVENAKAQWWNRTGWIIRLHDQTGAIGQGEASPLPGYSVESQVECEQILRLLKKEGLPSFHITGTLKRSLQQYMAAFVSKPPSIRFAIETALLDLVAQRNQVPLSSLFRELFTQPQTSVSLSAMISEGTRDAVFASVEQALSRGITTVKFKIGRPGAWVTEKGIVEALRKEYGDKLVLRLDVNQAWNYEQAAQYLYEIDEYYPEFIEEPCRVEEREKLLALDTKVPMALDESLYHQEASLFLNSQYVRSKFQVFILKPSALGGILKCLEFLEVAQILGGRIAISHLFEGPVGLSAVNELALLCSSSPCLIACGLDWPCVPLARPYPALPQRKNNVLSPGTYVGLGLTTEQINVWLS